MSTNCSICQKKLSTWLQNFPLENSHQEQRICGTCHDWMRSLTSGTEQGDMEDAIQYFQTRLSQASPEAKEIIDTAINTYQTMQRKKEEEKEEEKRRLMQRKDKEEKQRIAYEDYEHQRRKSIYRIRLEKLKEKGVPGYYEYKVISLFDGNKDERKSYGQINSRELEKTLNDLGADGWRLVTAYANEIGKTMYSLGIAGVSSGTNATIDEHILIFERYISL